MSEPRNLPIRAVEKPASGGRIAVILLVGMWVVLASGVFAVDPAVQAKLDRYRSLYQRYTEAVRDGLSDAHLRPLADELRAAEAEWRLAGGLAGTGSGGAAALPGDSGGDRPSLDGLPVFENRTAETPNVESPTPAAAAESAAAIAGGVGAPVALDVRVASLSEKSSMPADLAQGPSLSVTAATGASAPPVLIPASITGALDPLARVPTAEERRFEQLLAQICRPGSAARLDESIRLLEQFVASARELRPLWNASSELSDLYLTRGDGRAAEQVWRRFATRVRDREALRLATNRVREVRLQVQIQAARREFASKQATTGQRWQTYSTTSWWNVPGKVLGLGRYAVAAVSRRMAGGRLMELTREYEKVAAESYPKGTVDALTHSRVIPCNDVTLLVNGRAAFGRRYELIPTAKDSIVMQTLLYHNDATGNRLADLLIERAQAGVEVRVIVDDAFAQGGRKASILRKLQNGGVKVRINNPILSRPLAANYRSHQKMLVIDDVAAIVGGMNVADEYANGEITDWGWRDTDVEIRGPAVPEIRQLFENNWETLLTQQLWYKGDAVASAPTRETTEKLPLLPHRAELIPGPLPRYFDPPPRFENVRVRFVTTAPMKSKDDDILDLLLVYLANTRREAILETAYFIPTPALSQGIADACRRGVRVRILTNSCESNNHPNAGWAGRARYAEALRAGAELYEYRGAQTLHSKVSWFDGFAASLGAYNVNSRSHSCDAEDVIAFQDRRVAAAIKQMLDLDLSRARRITMQDVEGWRSDFGDAAKMSFFRLFDRLF